MSTVIRRIPLKTAKEASDFVDMFLQFQEGRGLSQKTIKVQRQILNILLQHCNDFRDEAACKKALANIMAGKNPAYYNKMLTTYKQFFDFLIQEGVINKNYVKGYKRRKEEGRIVIHKEDTIRRLLNVIDKNTFAGLRDYTFCLLALDTGIRPSEALKLRITDIDFDNKVVIVRKEYSKTGKERCLPVSIQTIHAIRKLIGVRAEDWDKNGTILCSYDGRELQTYAMRERFENYSKMMGVRVTTYDLRHTFATYYIKNGGDPFSLQKILGHSKMDMTNIYVNLANDDVAEKHKQATPLQNFMTKRVKKIKR